MLSRKNKHKNPVMNIEQSLEFLKRERRAFYDSLEPIECPSLSGAEVHFTAQGFNHLINESNSRQGDSKARKPTEQYMKLMHLQYVPYIIKECASIAESRPIKKRVKRDIKNGFQYELTCEIENIGKVSVVVEQIGNGKHKFLSVFPLYKKKSRRRNKKRPLGRS